MDAVALGYSNTQMRLECIWCDGKVSKRICRNMKIEVGIEVGNSKRTRNGFSKCCFPRSRGHACPGGAVDSESASVKMPNGRIVTLELCGIPPSPFPDGANSSDILLHSDKYRNGADYVQIVMSADGNSLYLDNDNGGKRRQDLA